MLTLLRFNEYQYLEENRLQWLKDNVKEIDSSHDDNAEHREPHAIIDHFAAADPSPKKTNTQWVINQYRKTRIRQEDRDRVGQALQHFERFKPRLEKKDINQYGSLSDLEDAVEPHAAAGGPVSKKEEKKAVKLEGADVVHDANGLRVIHTKTHAANQLYGKGTKWCTTMESPYHFNNYSKDGPLYQLHFNGGEKKYQFHFESGQYADEKDHTHPVLDLIAKHPEIKNVQAFKGKHYAFDSSDEFNSRVAGGHKYAVRDYGATTPIHADHKAMTLRSDTLEQAHKVWSDRIITGDVKHHKDAWDHLAGIAGHPNTPAHVIEGLADVAAKGAGKSEAFPLRQSIANNPGAPSHVLDKLYGGPTSHPDEVNKMLARNPKTGQATLGRMLEDKHVHLDLLKNPSLESHHITKMKGYADTLNKGDTARDMIHEAIAMHPKTSPADLHAYVMGDHHLAASNAVHNPNTPPEAFEAAMNKNDPIRSAMAKSPHTPTHILEKLSKWDQPFIAGKAAQNLASRGKKK
jgi:hypothetical protein